MESLQPELATPIFSKIYARFCNQPRITTVEPRAWPSDQEFVNSIVPAGYPAVFERTVDDHSQDVLGLFRAQYGHLPLKVRVADYDSPQSYVHDRKYVPMTLAEYLDYLADCRESPPKYAGNQPLPAELATCCGVVPPTFYPGNSFEPPAFWLGATHSITPLHKDSTDNFSFQIMGEKHWTLFPVRDIPKLAMSRPDLSDDMDFAVSNFDLRPVTVTHTLRHSRAQPITLTVRAGQMLYLPAGWAHYVETLSMSLTINYWLSRAFFRSLWMNEP